MKTKIISISTISVIVIAAAIVFCCDLFYVPEIELTDEQIAQLRTEYPICGKIEDVPPLMDMNTEVSLEETKESADNFIYGEIEGDMLFYSKALSTGNEELDNKRKSMGISDVYDYYDYTLVIYEDTQGKYKKGDKILLTSNVELMDFKPKLKDGMKVIVPVSELVNDPKRVGYSVYGTYYVTEDGYAISAYDEQYSKQKLSGAKVESVLKYLK